MWDLTGSDPSPSENKITFQVKANRSGQWALQVNSVNHSTSKRLQVGIRRDVRTIGAALEQEVWAFDSANTLPQHYICFINKTWVQSDDNSISKIGFISTNAIWGIVFTFDVNGLLFVLVLKYVYGILCNLHRLLSLDWIWTTTRQTTTHGSLSFFGPTY